MSNTPISKPRAHSSYLIIKVSIMLSQKYKFLLKKSIIFIWYLRNWIGFICLLKLLKKNTLYQTETYLIEI